MTEEELGERWDYKLPNGKKQEITAPFANEVSVKSVTTVIDAAVMRNAGSYANDGFATGNPLFSSNAVYHSQLTSTDLVLRAKFNIHWGDEITVAYKQGYWDGIHPAFIQFTTMNVPEGTLGDGEIPDVQFTSARESGKTFSGPVDLRTSEGRVIKKEGTSKKKPVKRPSCRLISARKSRKSRRLVLDETEDTTEDTDSTDIAHAHAVISCSSSHNRMHHVGGTCRLRG
jgi:hypothetical protein